jgi:YHS domain-containing protein
MQSVRLHGALALAAVLLALSGCGSPSNNTGPEARPSVDGPSEHGGHEPADMDKIKAVLATMSPEDAASVEKQHACPVGGELLGTMGAPIKVDVKGQTVWLCCEGCKDTLLANPDEYLAKLKKE